MPKISFDYDGTLSTKRGFNLATKLKSEGADLFIISARNDKQGMLRVAKQLRIPTDKVYATGSNKAKIEKVKELNIIKHYDNNPDVIKELDKIGKLI